MFMIEARNVNDALQKCVKLMQDYGQQQSSRVGDVLVLPGPLITSYSHPEERVLFSAARDANPFFHVVEALWMLAGRHDLATVEFFVRRMRDFSDDGKTLHGAYGRRWRSWFNRDQLDYVVDLLSEYPNSRRAVIQMWDPKWDLQTDEKMRDLPCNLTIHVQMVGTSLRRLDMTVFCRSNDMLWGAMGANAVHFSVLQEYLATRLGVPMGRLYQISDNAHVYQETFNNLLVAGYERETFSDLERYRVSGPDRIVSDVKGHPFDFDKELEQFFLWFHRDLGEGIESHLGPSKGKTISRLQKLRELKWGNSFFPEVAFPMLAAYQVFRRGRDAGRYPEMLDLLSLPSEDYEKSDWLLAARAWTRRRQEEFERRQQDKMTTEGDEDGGDN